MTMEISHIWLGNFPSKESYLEYVKESYSENDDEPINQFAQDQDVLFYDTDWEESFYDDSSDLKELIVLASYSKDYINRVISDAKTRGIESANTFIIVDKEEIPHPKSIEGENYKLWYMGEYECSV